MLGITVGVGFGVGDIDSGDGVEDIGLGFGFGVGDIDSGDGVEDIGLGFGFEVGDTDSRADLSFPREDRSIFFPLDTFELPLSSATLFGLLVGARPYANPEIGVRKMSIRAEQSGKISTIRIK